MRMIDYKDCRAMLVAHVDSNPDDHLRSTLLHDSISSTSTQTLHELITKPETQRIWVFF